MRRGILLIAALSACALFPSLDGLTGASDAGNDAARSTFTRTITIVNNATVALPAGYTIGVAFLESDLQADITQGKMRSDFGDLRVHGPSGERDRIVDVPPLARIVWFSLSASIAPGATDTTYTLTYGEPDAGAPPAAGASVFSFYDDFTSATLDPQWLTKGTVTLGAGMITLPQGTDGSLTTATPEDPQSTMETRVQVTNPASNDGQSNTDYAYWFGFQHSGDFTASPPWALWLSSDPNTISAYETADGCSSSCNSAAIPQTSAFRVYGIERPPTQTIFSVDGQVSYMTPANNDQPMSLMIRNFLVASDIVVDWVRSHVLIYPEPTVTLGPETSP